MFIDRTDAGQKLAKALEKYKGQDVLVLAIPRGGVEIGYQVAKHLGAKLSIIVTRKLPFPDNSESGFGAIAEDGSTYVFEHAKMWYSKDTIAQIMEEQREEIQRRVKALRASKPLPDIKDKIVILVDDGIAMGSTMRASIMLCKNKGARKIVVAAPVTGRDREEEIGELVDEIIILEKPRFFQAVAQVYQNWYDVPDKEVLEIMEKWEKL